MSDVKKYKTIVVTRSSRAGKFTVVSPSGESKFHKVTVGSKLSIKKGASKHASALMRLSNR